MTHTSTEHLHPSAKGLDALPGSQILQVLLSAQADAVAAVKDALVEIEAGAALMAEALRASGRLIYAGAGSSALMANADGMELHGTYGVDPSRIVLLMAGGLPQDARMPGDVEDDIAAAEMDSAQMRAGDVVIAVTASGNTPYPVEIARRARTVGARVIAVANNRNSPISRHADVAICLETPPEVIAGSTRMGAGTAQKVALNLMSTRMGIMLGQVHDGMMVGLIADNDKLRARAEGMVMTIADIGRTAAKAALKSANGAVKPAVLIARGASSGQAASLLADSQGNLRAALARMQETGPNDRPNTINQGSNS
jgi:N-acetylmuramic acid 6-phosphate etherase